MRSQPRTIVSHRRSREGLVVAVTTALLLNGCVTLLPKTDPVQLYTFARAASAPRPSTAQPVRVELGQVRFAHVGRTDSIVTRSGSRIASIAGARWAAPADILFTEVLAAAFDATPVVLVQRGGFTGAARLSVRVPTFEVVYPSANAPPLVVVSAAATLALPGGTGPPRIKTFRASRQASENRVSVIVAAYAAAVAEITDNVAQWTASQVAAERSMADAV